MEVRMKFAIMVATCLMSGCLLVGCTIEEAIGTALVSELFNLAIDALTAQGVVIPGV